MGKKKKSRGGATANRCTPTTGMQHKEIHEVHSKPTEATREQNFEGKEKKGMDRRLPRWRSTNVPHKV